MENRIEQLLKKHSYYKSRIEILEKQLKQLSPESYEDYIEYRMYKPGYSGATPKFIMEKGEEVAELNTVEATAEEYRQKCWKNYRKAKVETEKEIRRLKNVTMLIDDAIDTIGTIKEKLKIVIVRFYINNDRIEDIAEYLKVSRSRCYELCREAIKLMERMICREELAI